MAKGEEKLALIRRAEEYGDRTALVTPEGTISYSRLLSASRTAAVRLLDGAADLQEARVAFLVPPGFAYAVVQWGIWRAGGIAVPLATSHPAGELAYVLNDTQARTVVAAPELADRVKPLVLERGLRLLLTTELMEGGDTAVQLPAVEPQRRAMILYTSGTTSRPKGVVSSHANIAAQVTTLVDAWGWSAADHILLTLPLHHIHGIVNVLACALWSGARVTVHPRFEAGAVWEAIGRGDLTLFMAVPTIYTKLISAHGALSSERRAELSAVCRQMRLMVSGSAALPITVLEQWREISGHTLLERYGMTEIGMALSNPLHGERRPGFVGTPLPGVRVQLVDEAGRPVAWGEPGEIEVQGPAVFLEYWGKPEATRAAFRDGWFRTGDVAVVEGGAYRILGRSSVDIIKTGGYKVSALEIEEVFREHPAVQECAVVGLPDPEWGERVALAVVAAGGTEPTLEELRRWAGDRLAPYKLPTRLLTVAELPRNAMGKVTKPELVKLFQ